MYSVPDGENPVTSLSQVHGLPVTGVRWFGEDRLVTSSADNTAVLRDVASGDEVTAFKGMTSERDRDVMCFL